MRICSYNVNGLRALNRKNALSDLYATITPDILCLQEVRCDGDTFESIIHEINPDLGGYIVPNISNIGYAGVGTVYKVPNKEYNLGNLFILDNISSVNNYFSGRFNLTTLSGDDQPEVVLVNTYTLNSGGKDELRQQWDELFYNFIHELRKSYKLIICGDLNTVLDENDHWKGLSNVINQGPGLMDYEHQGLVKLLNLGFIDSYKYVHPSSSKKSWFSYRGNAYAKNHGWRLDYILVDDRIKNKILCADILEDFQGSDHRPIFIDINL